MKLICENKRDFLLGKKNYLKKVIEALGSVGIWI